MVILFLLLVAMTFTGTRVGLKRKTYAAFADEHSLVIGSLLGLQGLLLAFTFAMAGSRFETRHDAVIEETASIRRAVLAADLFGPSERQQFRKDLRGYLESRIQYFESGLDQQSLDANKERGRLLFLRLWNQAVHLPRGPGHEVAAGQMIEALQLVINAMEARHAAFQARVPDPIVYMLFALSVATAFFAGYAGVGRRKRDWMAILLFHFLVVMVIFITLDMDRPRSGLITVIDVHELTVNLRLFFRETE